MLGIVVEVVWIVCHKRGLKLAVRMFFFFCNVNFRKCKERETEEPNKLI